MLGVQVASALRDLYGRNGAETISGLCGTRVVLAAPDRDTAQWSADSLGRAEVEEVAEGFSYGANTIRDGVSLTPKRELRALALPSEIMRLENLSGYLKFPGPFPVASIRLKYVSRPQAAERFMPREGGGTEPGGNGTASEAGVAAPSVDDGMTIPDAAEAGRSGGLALPAPESGQAPVPRQGTLDLPPLPGEAGHAEAGAGTAADGGPGKSPPKREAPPGTGADAPATPALGPEPEDGSAAPDAQPQTPAGRGPRNGRRGRPGARRRAGPRVALTCSRSGHWPRRPRARPTTSATATTRRTIRSTARRAPGRERAPKNSG